MTPFKNFTYGSYDRKINNLSISFLEKFSKNREYCMILDSDNYHMKKYISYFNLCYEFFGIPSKDFY